MNRVILSPEYFPNPTIGRPISNADIYVGIIDLDPEIVGNQKQISVQQENGTIVQVSQPVSTGAGGVPLYNGSPVTILVDGDYSLKVLDSLGAQIYYVPSADFSLSTQVFQVATYAEASALTILNNDDQINIGGKASIGDGIGGVFYFDSSDLSTEITADSQQGVYLPPDSDVTGASGALVRIPIVSSELTEYATIGGNIAGAISLTHAPGTVGTASTSAPIAVNTFYRVTVSINTTTTGNVKILFDGQDIIFGDEPNGIYFSTVTPLLDGLENNRILDTTTYTYGVYTSGTSYSTLSVETDTLWGGTISSIEMAEVTEKPAQYKTFPSDGLAEDYYFALKAGSRNRSDIAFGDKSALGMFQYDGISPTPSANVAMGAKAQMTNQHGDENTAYGTFALQMNEGSDSVAVGYSALRVSTKGQENTAVGYKCLRTNTTGYRNTAIGFWAGGGITTGEENTSVGWRNNIAGGNIDKCVLVGSRAGTYLLDGSQNVIIGMLAGKSASSQATETLNLIVSIGSESNVFGDGSIAIGYQAKVGREGTNHDNSLALGRGADANALLTTALGYNTVASGDRSVAVGEEADVTGEQGTAVGALSEAKVGLGITSIGAQAGIGFTGANNTFLGRAAGNQVVTYVNCTLLGQATAVTADNQVQLGNSATTTYAYGAVQDRSDARDKVDVKDLTDAHIAFFMAVEWKQFRMDYREDYNWEEKDGTKERERFHIGAIAQQVEEAMIAHGVDFAGLQHHSISGGMDVYTIGYQEFVGIQGEIIQRQQKRLDSIEARLTAAGL